MFTLNLKIIVILIKISLAATNRELTYSFILFPEAAITNYHKLDGLKQQKLIFSQFWRSKAQNQCVSRVILPPEALEENPLPLPASGGSRCFLDCHWIIPISASVFTLPSPALPFSPLLCASLLCVSFMRTLVTGLRAHSDNPRWS